jgi:hypothetical protein
VKLNLEKAMTYEEVNALFVYDSDTGVLTNRVRRQYGRLQVGAESGSIAKRGYRVVRVFGELYPAHRLCWLIAHKEWPSGEIDHINGVRDDNRLCNLRDVTQSTNQRNAKRRTDNISGVVGLSFHKVTQKWQARIWTDAGRVHLGIYGDWFEAVCARKSAEVKHGYTGRG